MLNWNVDEERFKREDPENYKLWRLTQLINYGLDDGEKLDKNEVKEKFTSRLKLYLTNPANPILKDHILRGQKEGYRAFLVQLWCNKSLYAFPFF